MLENLPEYKDVESKLVILYLINRMVLPMSRGQIVDMIMENEFMDFFTLQQNLSEMTSIGLLESTQENAGDNNTTRYTVTEDGLNTLEFFERRISVATRQIINQFANENRHIIKKDYEKTATFFPDETLDEFRVKCGIYEDERALLELFITVDTREQARLIQNNWRTNAAVYSKILDALTMAEESPEDLPSNDTANALD
ncbi:MAG: DUF4364 family protein [Defluviitaleaceae bacterium]|nr:DUF4364 family protein [Defluviitaleaceae bacterium]MCL2273936.1 DUF4364 family protein [Defluviitaleaceae bacterium]